MEASDILVEDLEDESLEVGGMTRPGWLASEAMSSSDRRRLHPAASREASNDLLSALSAVRPPSTRTRRLAATNWSRSNWCDRGV